MSADITSRYPIDEWAILSSCPACGGPGIWEQSAPHRSYGKPRRMRCPLRGKRWAEFQKAMRSLFADGIHPSNQDTAADPAMKPEALKDHAPGRRALDSIPHHLS